MMSIEGALDASLEQAPRTIAVQTLVTSDSMEQSATQMEQGEVQRE